MVARVPTLAIWDDHDICDGWGSLPPERMDSPFGRAVFAVARELYLLFQQGAVAPDYPPAFGDRSGTSLGWHLRLPCATLKQSKQAIEQRLEVVTEAEIGRAPGRERVCQYG